MSETNAIIEPSGDTDGETSMPLVEVSLWSSFFLKLYLYISGVPARELDNANSSVEGKKFPAIIVAFAE